ncbi:hypothetical protein BC939DRAFT_460096 [Gamsiella multidivaricata]|uniref:uncharacterized protein n=1 Tax=Gamsiella multidivaricata TaxID=101098 RepID=UPI00221E9A2C|nr:uncharacterized protein BC939DRAFT_460096 [Gamsiella multidivaricata]KAI7819374.1 hypothetical protein BC939DRAFT_460096 [Gamsiella multidivaricata]
MLAMLHDNTVHFHSSHAHRLRPSPSLFFIPSKCPHTDLFHSTSTSLTITTMTDLKTRFARVWPRLVVGLWASHDLLTDLGILYIGLRADSLLKNGYFRGYLSNSPEEEERIVKATLIFVGGLFSVIDVVALYAAVRKSITATKISLAVWCFRMAASFLTLLFMSFVLFLSDETRDHMPRPGVQAVCLWVMRLFSQLLYGWSLVVILRDLRGQGRNIWGRLVGPHEQPVYEEAHIRLPVE